MAVSVDFLCKYLFSDWLPFLQYGQFSSAVSGNLLTAAASLSASSGPLSASSGSFYNNESSYVGTIKSDITYYNSSLTPELVYVDGYETPGRNEDTNPHIDERPMIAKLYGPNKGAVTNSTTHKLSSITYTTSFLTNSRKDGRWFKGFDLTEKPEFA